jgi:hypothetical protein
VRADIPAEKQICVESYLALTRSVTISCSVADLASGAFLTSGSGIRDEIPGSYFRELGNNFKVKNT